MCGRHLHQGAIVSLTPKSLAEAMDKVSDIPNDGPVWVQSPRCPRGRIYGVSRKFIESCRQPEIDYEDHEDYPLSPDKEVP